MGLNVLSLLASVPNSGASGIFLVGVVHARNRAVEDNVATFSLLYAGREGYAEASTTSNSTIMVCQVVNYSSDGGKSC